MHKFMYFQTKLFIVFQNEATRPWALSFKLKRTSSQFETYIKERQGRNIYTFIYTLDIVLR